MSSGAGKRSLRTKMKLSFCKSCHQIISASEKSTTHKDTGESLCEDCTVRKSKKRTSLVKDSAPISAVDEANQLLSKENTAVSKKQSLRQSVENRERNKAAEKIVVLESRTVTPPNEDLSVLRVKQEEADDSSNDTQNVSSSAASIDALLDQKIPNETGFEAEFRRYICNTRK